MGWKQEWDRAREAWDSDLELRKAHNHSIESYQQTVRSQLLRSAKTMIDLTQFNYHTINTPELIRSNDLARLILQFKKWTVNQTNLMYRNFGKPLRDIMGGKAAREEVDRAVRLSSVYALMAGASYFTAYLPDLLEETAKKTSGKTKKVLKTSGKAVKSLYRAA